MKHDVEIGPERALEQVPVMVPHHDALEPLLPGQATALLSAIYGRSKGHQQWHFQEVLDDPAYIRVTFDNDSSGITFWFKEAPTSRTFNILEAYGFVNVRYAMLPPQAVKLMMSISNV